MGNSCSSSCSCIPNSISGVNIIGIFNEIVKCSSSKNKTAMLLDTDGNIREIKLPVKTAELMIEAIGHVITPAEEIRRTRRITALPADQELVAKKFYLLVPASRLNSKASEFEMAIAEEEEEEKQKISRKIITSGIRTAKVSPSPLGSEKEGGENDDEFAAFPSVVGTSTSTSLRMGNQKRWSPVLDPICE